MIKYEVNKVTKQDVEQEVADMLQYEPNTKEFDIEANKIADALYTGRNYTLSNLTLQYGEFNNDASESYTNLAVAKDVPNLSNMYILANAAQYIGLLHLERAISSNTNAITKKDLTIDNMKTMVKNVYDSMIRELPVLAIGANYVSDKDPSELLRGTWELKAETKIGKIWERVK